MMRIIYDTDSLQESACISAAADCIHIHLDLLGSLLFLALCNGSINALEA